MNKGMIGFFGGGTRARRFGVAGATCSRCWVTWSPAGAGARTPNVCRITGITRTMEST